jgi:hypothetical protein
MKYVRIYAEYVQNKDEYPMTFDFLLDDAGKPAGQHYTYGLSGRPEESGECFPFALVADGSMDFGSAYQNEEDRWWKTNLREQNIEPNAPFKIWEKEQEYDYTIVKIDVLSG